MVEVRAFDLEKRAAELGNTVHHLILLDIVHVVVLSRVPWVGSGNEPLKEIGLNSGVLVDVRVPNPEYAVLGEPRMSGEAEEASLVVRPRDRIAETGKTGNPRAERANFRA